MKTFFAVLTVTLLLTTSKTIASETTTFYLEDFNTTCLRVDSTRILGAACDQDKAIWRVTPGVQRSKIFDAADPSGQTCLTASKSEESHYLTLSHCNQAVEFAIPSLSNRYIMDTVIDGEEMCVIIPQRGNPVPVINNPGRQACARFQAKAEFEILAKYTKGKLCSPVNSDVFRMGLTVPDDTTPRQCGAISTGAAGTPIYNMGCFDARNGLRFAPAQANGVIRFDQMHFPVPDCGWAASAQENR